MNTTCGNQVDGLPRASHNTGTRQSIRSYVAFYFGKFNFSIHIFSILNDFCSKSPNSVYTEGSWRCCLLRGGHGAAPNAVALPVSILIGNYQYFSVRPSKTHHKIDKKRNFCILAESGTTF